MRIVRSAVVAAVLSVVLSSAALAQWQSMPLMISARFDPIMAGDANNVYVFGGVGNVGFFLRNSEKFRVSSNSWTTIANLPTALAVGKAAVLNGWVYIPGGFDGTDVVSTLTAYSTILNFYDTSREPVPQARYGYSFDVLGGLLYLCGGGDDLDDSHAECWTYDPDADLWEPIASMPQTRRFHGSGVLGGKLYVFGGLDANDLELTTTDVYNPANDTWSSGPGLPIPWWAGASGAANGRIMFSHGVSNDSLFAKGYILSSAAGPWQLQSGNVQNPRLRVGSAVSGNALWVGAGDPLGVFGFPSDQFEKYIVTAVTTTTTTTTTHTTTTTPPTTTSTTSASTTSSTAGSTTTTTPATTSTTTTTQPSDDDDDDWPHDDDADDDTQDDNDSGLGGIGDDDTGGSDDDDDDDDGGGGCG